MRLIKLGVCSLNTTVGAFQQNADKAVAAAQAMAEDGVTLGVFQEGMIGGYPSEDLIQWQGFVEKQWDHLQRFAQATATLDAAFVLGVSVSHHGLRYNCAALVAAGEIQGLVPKQKLPTYNVFYEGRTYTRGFPFQDELHKGVPFGDLLFQLDFGVVAPEVCEDLWSGEGPIRWRAYSGAELVVNISASPFRLGHLQSRRELVAQRAADNQCTIAYANAVGSNDGLIFDGGGFINQNGKWVLEAPRYKEGFASAVVDLDRTSRLRSENTTWRMDRDGFCTQGKLNRVVLVKKQPKYASRAALRYPTPSHQSYFLPASDTRRSSRVELCEDILDSLALGVGDYFEKTRAFKSIGIALSGGRDSLLTLLIAHRYARRRKPEAPGSLMKAFYMPSRFSSAETRAASEKICQELGIPLEVIPIDDAFEREKEAAQKMLGPGETLTAITEQNIQARIRAQRMWNWANSSGGLFLQTGNMSEKAVGYTTIGGDLMGALSVISNVPKTVVMYLLNYLLETTQLEGIALALKKPAGPELASNQLGEEELMPFPVLDACFYLFASEKLLPHEIQGALEQMFPKIPAATLKLHVEKFIRLFMQSIYKWVQSPLSLHIGNLDLDRERALQLPVVTSAAWTKTE